MGDPSIASMVIPAAGVLVGASIPTVVNYRIGRRTERVTDRQERAALYADLLELLTNMLIVLERSPDNAAAHAVDLDAMVPTLVRLTTMIDLRASKPVRDATEALVDWQVGTVAQVRAVGAVDRPRQGYGPLRTAFLDAVRAELKI